jgi:hypothetical protein
VKTSEPGENENDTKNSAAAPPKNDNKSTVVANSELFAKLNVARGDVKLNGETLIQQQVNAIGIASMGYSAAAKQAKTAAANTANAIPVQGPYAGKVVKTEVAKKNATVTEYTLPQNTTIQNAINQIIISSNYGVDELKREPNKTTGMKNWWRIETEKIGITHSRKDTGWLQGKDLSSQAQATNPIAFETRQPVFSVRTFLPIGSLCKKDAGLRQSSLPFNVPLFSGAENQ